MIKYHPGDKLTVRATVRHNCMSPDLLGIVIGDDDVLRQTTTIPVSAIITHEKVPLRKGDIVKVRKEEYNAFKNGGSYTVLEVYGDYAWIRHENCSPMTYSIDSLERV